MSATAILREIVLPVGDLDAATLHAQVLGVAAEKRGDGVALTVCGGTDLVVTPDGGTAPDERARPVVVYGVSPARFEAVSASSGTSGVSVEVVDVRVPGCGRTAYLRDSAGTVLGVEQRDTPETGVARLEIAVERIEEAESFFETAFVLPPAERGLLPGAKRYVWIDLGSSGIMLCEQPGRSGPTTTFEFGVSAEHYDLLRRALARMKHSPVAVGTDSGVTVVDDGGGRQFRWRRQDVA